jgi:tRNA nucleotidyltransferase (CCA-adding enzyme)
MTQFDVLCLLLIRLDNQGVRRCYLTGGCVRDAYLHGTPVDPNFDHPSIKDFDVEVFGVTADVLVDALKASGAHVDFVGESFGVYKVVFCGHTFDFSLPRRERKSGLGYTGFEVEVDPEMTLDEAASRRDLTINAIYYSVREKSLYDPYNGLGDLFHGRLDAVSDRFKEDPLRVLRVMQFAARFGFHPTVKLIRMCNHLLSEKDALTPERVWGEWEKWCLKSIKPSAGMGFMRCCDWADEIFDRLSDTPQDPDWHPEGNAFVHTMWVVNEAAAIRDREKLDRDDAIVLMLAALCHDFGKPETTVQRDGRWSAPGHAAAGVGPTLKFLVSIGCPQKYIHPVLTLVAEHMAHLNEATPRSVRRLVNRLVKGGTTLRLLAFVVEADSSGRPPLEKGMPEEMVSLLQVADDNAIDGSVPVPALVTGKDLIALGMAPGPDMGKLLKRLYNEQIDGSFTEKEDGLSIARSLRDSNQY